MLEGHFVPGIRSATERGADGLPVRVWLEERTGPVRCVIGRRDTGAMNPDGEALNTLGADMLLRALKAPGKWVVVDEVGFLEESSPAYLQTLERLFEEKQVLAVLRKEDRRHLRRLRNREDCFVVDLDGIRGPSVGCVVMAAGQGSRFGSNKLLHPLGEKPVLAHVLDQLPREGLDRLLSVVSSVGAENLCLERDVPCLRYAGGPQSETIHLGVAQMEEMDGCMFVMGDQPMCSRSTMEHLLDAFRTHPNHIVRTSWQGVPSSPTIFPRKYFAALAQLTGEQGGMTAVRGLDPDILLVEAENEVEVRDVDTTEDIKRLAQLLGEDCS